MLRIPFFIVNVFIFWMLTIGGNGSSLLLIAFLLQMCIADSMVREALRGRVHEDSGEQSEDSGEQSEDSGEQSEDSSVIIPATIASYFYI